MEVDTPYPILHAYKKFQGSSFITTLILEAEDKSVHYVILDPYFSFVFRANDILDINAQKGKLKLIYRKRNCDTCHVLDIARN
jgi:hypothetical protein